MGGRWAHPYLFLVCGEHVALAEGVETSPVYFRKELGVIFADVGDLVERKDYRIVESHEQEEGGDMAMWREAFPDL